MRLIKSIVHAFAVGVWCSSAQDLLSPAVTDVADSSVVPDSGTVPAEGLSLVVFYEPQCAPCQQVIQHMRYLKRQYWNVPIFYGAINVARRGNSNVPIPQFVAMRDGVTLEQIYADPSVLISEMNRIVSEHAAAHGGGDGGGGEDNGGGDVEPLV